jgi:hypothetical protein
MAKVMVAGPFQELNVRHEVRPEPTTVRHLGLGQWLPPAATLRLGRVHKWATRDFKATELLNTCPRVASVKPLRVRAT